MQPPKRSGNGAVIAIIVGGGLVALVLLVVTVVVVAANGNKSPAERLNAAANSLSTARTVKLKGSFSYASDNLQGEITVTRGGRVGGQVTWNGDRVSILGADDKLFVKASKSYWTSKLTSSSSNNFLKEGDQWGMVRSSELSLDFDRELTPSALAADMRRLNRSTLRQQETTVQGRKAYRVGSSLTSFYLSEDGELLRYSNNLSPRVTAEVEVQSTAAASSTISQMRSQMGELADSFDASKTPRNAAKPEFVDCDKGGQPCTVRVRVWSTRGGSPSVPIKVNFRLTSAQGGGTLFGECQSTGTVTGLDDVTVQCTISGGEWARSGKNARRVWVSATPMAIAATSSDVAALQRGLDSE